MQQHGYRISKEINDDVNRKSCVLL